MTIILVTALYAAACIGVGSVCLRVFFDDSGRSSAALQFGVGSTLLSAGWIFIALAEFLIPAVVWTIILPLALYAIFQHRHVRWPSYKQTVNLRSALFWISTAALSCLLLWHAVLAFYRPPFGDADAFYMTYPKIIAAAGRLEAMGFTYHDFSAVGLSGEMHFATLMVIGFPMAAKLFAWVTGVGILFLMTEMTGWLGGRRLAKLLLVASLVTSTTITDYLSDGKTELFPTLSALTVIALILRWPITINNKKGIIFIGIATGIIAYSKFSYIICMLPTVAALVIFTSRVPLNKEGLKTFTFELTLTGVGFGLGLLPHLIKNWILFSNAAAPFFGMKKNWADQAQWFSALDTAWIVSTFPFSLVVGKYPLMGGSLSLIWLMALPFTGFACRARGLKSPLMQVSLSALLGVVCWLIVKPSIFAPRYFLPNLILLMPLPFIGLERYVAWPRCSRLALGLFGALASAVVLIAPTEPPAGVWSARPSTIYQYAMSDRSKCGLAISDYCSIFDKLNGEVPAGTRLFVLGFYTYWLDADLLGRLNTDDEYQSIKTLPPDIWQTLFERGFSTVAVQTASHGRYLSYLRSSPVPDKLEVVEKYSNSNMPTFSIRKNNN